MAISWSDAVADADNSGDRERYRRAVAQVADLEPLIASFAKAVRDSGKWPHGRIETRAGQDRHVWVYPDGTWGIELGAKGYAEGILGYLVKKIPSGGPVFGNSGLRESATIAAEDFGARMDAMEQTKDWVPRELVAYLRTYDIPIPNM